MKKIVFTAVLALLLAVTGHSQTLLEESFEDGVIPPTGWTSSAVCAECSPDTWFGWSAATTAYSGDYSAFVEYAYPSHSSYLVTPQLALSGHKVLTFWFSADFNEAAQYTTFTVEISTTGNAPSDFTVLQTVTFPGDNDYDFLFQNVVVDLQAYSGQNVYLAFHIEDEYGTGVYIDDVVVGDIPDCLPPVDLTVVDVGDTTITVSWSPLQPAPLYTVQWQEAQSGWVNPVSYTTTDTFFTVTGVWPAWYFDIRVRAECGGSQSSVWTEETMINTPCLPHTVTNDNIWIDDFETAVGEGLVALYNCWPTPIMSPSYQTPALFCGLPEAAHSGGNSLELRGNNGEVNLLVFPAFTNNLSLLRMSFFANTTAGSSNTAGTFEIGYVTDVDDPSTFTLVELLVPKSESFNRASSAPYGPYYFLNAPDTARMAIRFTPNAYSTSWNLDDITVSLIPDCTEPMQLDETNISATSANLFWATSGDYTYDILIWPSGTQDTTYYNNVAASDLPFTVDSLQATTAYSWTARTNCDDGSHSVALTNAHFTTTIAPVSFPYLQTFEGDSASYAEFEMSGSGMNQWYVGTATGKPDPDNPGTAHSLYISNNQGLSNLYSGSNYSHAYAYMNVDFPADMLEYHLEFDCKVQGEPGWDYLSVYLMETVDDVPSVWEPNGVELVSGLTGSNTWEHISRILPNVAGTTKRIVFYWVNDGYYFVNPPAAVDNISITAEGCPRPTDVTVTNIQDGQVTLSWQENGTSTSWIVHYKPSNAPASYPLATDTVYGTPTLTLYGLSSNTDYYCFVTSICEGGEISSASSIATFRTPCGSNGITELPYIETFSQYESLSSSPFDRYAPCWSRLASNPDHRPYVNIADFPTNCLDFHYTPSCYTMAVLPMLNASIPVNTVMLTFNVRRQNLTQGTMEVGVMTNPSDASTFVPVDTVTLASSATWEEYTTYFNSYTGVGQYLAFKVNNGGNNSIVIDDVTLDYMPSCFPVTDVTITNITQNSVTVSWSGEAEGFDVYIHGPTMGVFYTTENSITLTNLEPSSSYGVWVQAVCEFESSNIIGPLNFQTMCGAVTVTADLPWTETFENYQGSDDHLALSPCWAIPVPYTNYYGTTYPIVYNNNAITHSGNRSLEIRGANCMVVLPEFTNDINTLRLSLWGSTFTINSLYAGTMELGIIADVNNPASFMPLDTIAPLALGRTGHDSPNMDHFGPYDFHNVAAPSGSRIAFRYSNSYYEENPWNFDDFEVSLIPECASPVKNSITFTNVTADEATVNWVDNDTDHTVWELHYREAVGNHPWQTVTVVTTPSYTLHNLNPNTTYEAYVVTVCGAIPGSDSTYVKPFTTIESSTALPYTTDFTQPNEWTINNGIYSTQWTIGPVPGTDYNALFVTADGVNPGYYTYMDAVLTAEKMLTVGTNAEILISFDLRVGGDVASDIDFDFLKLFLAPSTQAFVEDAGGATEWALSTYSTYAFNFSEYLPLSSSSTTPYSFCLTNGNTIHVDAVMPNPNVNPGSNSVAKLVFVWVNDAYDGTQPGAIISNLSVMAVSCPKPTQLTVTNIGSTSVDLAWNVAQNETAWNLEYKETGDTTWTSLPLTTNSYHLTGLSALTSYQIRVQSDCGAGEVSAWTNAAFVTQNCDVADQCSYTFYMTDTYGDGWNGAALNVRQDGMTVATLTVLGGHTQTESVPLCDGASVTLMWSGGPYDDECKFYVFDPNGTQIYESPSLSQSSGTNLFTFVTDCNAIPLCEAPFAVSVSGITDTSATVFWMMSGNSLSWALQYRSDSTAAWSPDVLADTNIFDLTGLVPATTYQLRVKALCGNGNESDWSDAVTFTTAFSGAAPVVVTTAASNITESSARLNANIVNPDNVPIESMGFEWWGETGPSSMVPGTLSGTSFYRNIVALEPSTTYTFRAFISTATATYYGEELTFTTLAPPCPIPYGLDTTSVSTDMVTLSWTDNDLVNMWTIRYREEGGSWIYMTTNSNSFTMAGLSPQTTYEFQVQSNCGEGDLSDWSGSLFVTTLGVGLDSWLSKSVKLYPNPAQQYVDIRVSENVNVTAMEVYDVYGKIVAVVETGHASSLQTRIDVSGLADGIYFVRVTTEDGLVTKQFVKK